MIPLRSVIEVRAMRVGRWLAALGCALLAACGGTTSPSRPDLPVRSEALSSASASAPAQVDSGVEAPSTPAGTSENSVLPNGIAPQDSSGNTDDPASEDRGSPLTHTGVPRPPRLQLVVLRRGCSALRFEDLHGCRPSC